MTDAILNVPFSSLRNKRKIIINNSNGSAPGLSTGFGPAAPNSLKGRNDSFIWEGPINDPTPNANRSNQQWIVFRKFVLNSKISVVNNAQNGYDNVFISWETPGGAYNNTNPPAFFKLRFGAADSSGAVISTSPDEVTPGVLPVEAVYSGGHASKEVGIIPYCAFGGSDAWNGAVVPAAAPGDAQDPQLNFNLGIGGTIMRTWEEGILVPNLFNGGNFLIEIRNDIGQTIGITCRDLAGNDRSSHVTYGGLNLPGVAVNWNLECDVYDILPSNEKSQALDPRTFPPRV
tara:strand:+ start:1850 stop:2713 length:864 start_codon:yes stop_codon:yes gene_type:complete